MPVVGYNWRAMRNTLFIQFRFVYRDTCKAFLYWLSVFEKNILKPKLRILTHTQLYNIHTSPTAVLVVCVRKGRVFLWTLSTNTGCAKDAMCVRSRVYICGVLPLALAILYIWDNMERQDNVCWIGLRLNIFGDCFAGVCVCARRRT